MKNKITITLQYQNHLPVIFFERATGDQTIARTFETAKKLISKSVQAQGRKMPLVKLEAPAGFAPASMDIFYNKEDSTSQTDVFLFGNLNVLHPERTRTSSSFKRNNQPKFTEKITPTPIPIQIPN